MMSISTGAWLLAFFFQIAYDTYSVIDLAILRSPLANISLFLLGSGCLITLAFLGNGSRLGMTHQNRRPVNWRLGIAEAANLATLFLTLLSDSVYKYSLLFFLLQLFVFIVPEIRYFAPNLQFMGKLNSLLFSGVYVTETAILNSSAVTAILLLSFYFSWLTLFVVMYDNRVLRS